MIYIIERRDGREKALEGVAAVMQFAVQRCPATWPRILAAAHVKAHHPISYADAFAVALAQEMDASVVTGDPEFECVEGLISVFWLPTKT
jgi:predicted nucleic acid-binding protein